MYGNAILVNILCYDAEQDAVPEFALALLANEQDLVDKMQATIENAQRNALLDRSWDPDPLDIFEHRLQATVQASAISCANSCNSVCPAQTTSLQ